LQTVASKITCYDEDDLDSDDLMATGHASSNGKFHFSYTEKTPLLPGGCGWDCLTNANPEIYCYVEWETSSTPTIFPFRTGVKQNWNQDNVLDWGTVTVYPDRRHTSCANTCGPAGIDNLVPDFEFTEECRQHDCCYDNCEGETQESCDSEFYDLMLSRCRYVYGDYSLISQCYARAKLYHSAVTAYGKEFFECDCHELHEDEETENDISISERYPADDGYVYLVDKRAIGAMIVVVIGTIFCIIAMGVCSCFCQYRISTESVEIKDAHRDAETVTDEEIYMVDHNSTPISRIIQCR